MGFSGTQEKCKGCDQKVYIVDMVTADGVNYHRNCFKCAHCNGKLALGRYSSLNGVLYCTPHFQQLYKKNGGLAKLQRSMTEKPNLPRAPSKLSALFRGTQEKCAICDKTAYPLEKLMVDGQNYHKKCFRCAKGGCNLTQVNYATLDGVLYCRAHYDQMFKEKGSYGHLAKSLTMRRAASSNSLAAAAAEAVNLVNNGDQDATN